MKNVLPLPISCLLHNAPLPHPLVMFTWKLGGHGTISPFWVWCYRQHCAPKQLGCHSWHTRWTAEKKLSPPCVAWCASAGVKQAVGVPVANLPLDDTPLIDAATAAATDAFGCGNPTAAPAPAPAPASAPAPAPSTPHRANSTTTAVSSDFRGFETDVLPRTCCGSK